MCGCGFLTLDTKYHKLFLLSPTAEIKNGTPVYSAVSPKSLYIHNSVIVLEYKHFVVYFASTIYTLYSGQGKRLTSRGVPDVPLGRLSCWSVSVASSCDDAFGISPLQRLPCCNSVLAPCRDRISQPCPSI